jgi:TonB family protein
VGLLALPALAVPAAAMAEEAAPEALPFTGRWVARYDPDSCGIAARFGEGDNAVTASFTRYQPGDHFNLTLIGKRLRFSQPRLEANLDFGIKADLKREVMVGTMGSTPAIFFTAIRFDGLAWKGPPAGMPKVTREMENSVTGVTVSIKGGKPFRLIVAKGFANPMIALRVCMDDLIKTWGYDPAVQAALTRPVTPTNPPGSWLTNDDYPMMAIRNGANGLVQFRLDVDPEGKIAGCHILARTSPDEFADVTCKLMTKRARFQPALDSEGRPVGSYFVSTAHFVIPY